MFNFENTLKHVCIICAIKYHIFALSNIRPQIRPLNTRVNQPSPCGDGNCIPCVATKWILWTYLVCSHFGWSFDFVPFVLGNSTFASWFYAHVPYLFREHYACSIWFCDGIPIFQGKVVESVPWNILKHPPKFLIPLISDDKWCGWFEV